MNDTEIKTKLFQQIVRLKNERLIELYGVVSNFINSSDDSEEWEKLSSAQKKGLESVWQNLKTENGLNTALLWMN